MRYKKQTDEFRCFPISLLNAMKWSGIKASHDDWGDFLCSLCNLSKNGTYKNAGIRAVKFIATSFQSFSVADVVYKPSISSMMKHVVDNDGAIIIINELYFEPDFHASLLINHNGKLAVVNGRADKKKKTIFYLNDDILKTRIVGNKKRKLEYGIFLIRENNNVL